MLITDNYKNLLIQEHIKQPTWGQTAVHRVDKILSYAKNSQDKIILDYGSGSGSFKQYIDKNHKDYTVIEYDPGKPGKDMPPTPQNFVICIDVLEHVEPECIDSVLDDLQRLVLHSGLFTISLIPARKLLLDGRNAHLTLESASWWREKLEKRFKIDIFSTDNKSIFVTVFKKELN